MQSHDCAQLPNVLREVLLLDTLCRHPHVVKLFGLVSDNIVQGQLSVVLERASCGSLKDVVRNKPSSWHDRHDPVALLQVRTNADCLECADCEHLQV